MRRRDFLGGDLRLCAGASVLGASTAHAGTKAPVAIARLSVPNLPDPRPGALEDLLGEVEQNSSVIPQRKVREIAPDSPSLWLLASLCTAQLPKRDLRLRPRNHPIRDQPLGRPARRPRRSRMTRGLRRMEPLTTLPMFLLSQNI